MKKISIILFFIPYLIFAQNNIDSLFQVLENTKLDSTKLILLNDIAWKIRYNDTTKSKELLSEALELSIKINNKAEQSRTLAIQGNLCKNKGDFENALLLYDQAKKIRVTIDNKKLLAEINNHIGIVYVIQSDYPSTLKYWKEGLEIYKEIEDKQGIASIIGNIGIVYDNLGDYEKAISYYLEAALIHSELKDKAAQSVDFNNIGLVYVNIKNYKKGFEYQRKALQIRMELEDLNGLGDSYTNLAELYKRVEKIDSAIISITKALELKRKIGHKAGIALALLFTGDILLTNKEYTNALKKFESALVIEKELDNKFGIAQSKEGKGLCYLNLNQYVNSKKNLLEALSIFQELEAKDQTANTYRNLSELEAKTGDFVNAYNYRLLFYEIKSNVLNSESTKQIAEMDAKYENTKKEFEIQLLKKEGLLEIERHNIQIAIENEEQKKQQIIIYSIAGGLFLIIVFSILIFRRLQITRKQKLVIEEQKEEVETQRDQIEGQKDEIEQKHGEIQESIVYAKRIQNAILPPDSFMTQYLPNNFVYYQPKDVVAGDFYWMETHNDTVFFAAADCTGHGVPGAMVSVVCHNALNRAVREFGLRDTGKILDKVRELVLITFEKSEEQMKDGMDICLCAWNKTKNQLQYSGANNPLYLVKDGELETIKGTKQPIGHVQNPIPFESHDIDVKDIHSFYLTTDGYADQFGGPKNKKFSYKRLRELLVENHSKPMNEQHDILKSELNNWIKEGDDEQIDDVCMIGIKI